MKNKPKKMTLKNVVSTLLLLLVSCEAYSCILGPESVEAKTEKDFLFEIKPDNTCKNCEIISITAPSLYKENKLMHLLFKTIIDDQVKSIAYIPMTDLSNFPTFGVLIARDSGTKYELRIIYGNSHCSSYSIEKDFVS